MKSYERGLELIFQVIHGEPLRSQMAIGDSGRSTVRYRPGYSDLLRFDGAEGRLRVCARLAKLVSAYRGIVGRALFNDAEFFTSDVACTLEPLQQRRKELFERLPMGVLGVRVTELGWLRDGALHRIRADDCLEHVERLKLPLQEGRLVAATLELRFLGGRGLDYRRVVIRPPGRITYQHDRHENAIEHFLRHTGLRPRRRSDDGATLWTLFPWRHPEARWRTLLGKQTDLFLTEGLLVACALAEVDHRRREWPRSRRDSRSPGGS